MNKIIFNPSNYTEQYLKYLNVCFPNWGDEKLFDWVYSRQVGQYKSDFIIITDEEDEVIAGSGITYRNIKTKEGTVLSIGVFTGSWTLPKARGRGCFTQIIEEFTELCTAKNIDYLTAFVTESNASYRRFDSIGFKHLQADNVFSNLDFDYENFGLEVLEIDCDPEAIYSIYEDFIDKNGGYYYKYEEFLGQYLNRKIDVQVLQIEENIFVIEENETTYRILFYSNFDIRNLMTLSAWVKEKKQKKIMLFLSDKAQIEVCESNKFINVNSFFTFKNTSSKLLLQDNSFESFIINLADKM